MLMVLDLFDESRVSWTADAICERLHLSTSSGYRYIRELAAAGLLARLPKGMYVLGPRIIELEYVMRTSDPVARAGLPILRSLARSTGCDVLFSNIHGLHIINVLHVHGVENLAITYTRGRQHPLFRGAVAKSILPFLGRSQLLKIYESKRDDVAEAGLGETWLQFWRTLQTMKKQGFSESQGELDPGIHGLGVPLLLNGSVMGSVSLVYSSERAKLLNVAGLIDQMQSTASELAAAIQETQQTGSTPQASREHTG